MMCTNIMVRRWFQDVGELHPRDGGAPTASRALREDKALKAAMAKFGPETPSRWDKVAKAVGTSRSGQQCKKREQWLKKNQA